MALSKTVGNMYPWVTHMASFIHGQCPHRCLYCYTKRGRARRFAEGPLELSKKAFNYPLGSGRVIFIEHRNDLWAEEVPAEWIRGVLLHCRKYDGNEYVFQTKNPRRYADFLDEMPANTTLGVTIETDSTEIAASVSNAPPPLYRAMHMPTRFPCFVTVEPIMQFNLGALMDMIREVNPLFVNVGADSKGNNLPEPTGDEVVALVDAIKAAGIEVRAKTNLVRILSKQE